MSPTKRGPAYPLWREVEKLRLEKRWTKSELAERTGLRRATIDNLASSSRPPLPRIVTALADAVGLDRDKAYELAGLLPEPTRTGEDPIITEIRRSRNLTPAQQDLLTGLVEMLNNQNRAIAGAPEDEVERDGRTETGAG